ncbi:CdaR family protein [Clostridium sp. E02]|uniref:CdaR family protein n=1 Tax=Clostridium sp. E02 TaxID=2487134 RepID=UPI000F53FD63|nr:CdaR family protein [Clostridium sp. E02]
MKKKILNNLGLKIASLVLAFIVWMAVVNISNPVVYDSQVVSVDVLNGKVLKAADLTYEIVGKDTVMVSYQIRTRDRSLVKSSDFHAYVDLKNLYDVTGAVPVTVDINKEKENLIKNDTITAKPMVIRINTERLQRKKFNLQVKTQGAPQTGYALGRITLSPDQVTVEGPESQIGKINHVGVEIDVDNKNMDMNGSSIPIFYDANGNELELSDQVKIDRNEIEYQILVLKAKDIALNFEISGEVAKGYRYTGVVSEVRSIPVVGTRSVLASLSTLAITSDELNLDGASQDKVVKLDLNQYLPPNTSIVGDQYKKVTVRLKVEPLTTKTYQLDLSDLDKTGASDAYEYSFDKQATEVTIKGLKEDLDSLDLGNLNAVLDVTGLKPGSYPGMLNLSISGGFEVVGYQPFHVIVAQNHNGAETQGETVESDSTTAASTSAAEEDTTKGTRP